MSYEPTIWKKGDKVTSTKLNKIENGIQGNDTEISNLKEGLSAMSTATSSDVGKALKAKTVTDGKVTEWEFGEAGGTVELDDTLTDASKAAQAKAVGNALNHKMDYDLAYGVESGTEKYLNRIGNWATDTRFRYEVTDIILCEEGHIFNYAVSSYGQPVATVLYYLNGVFVSALTANTGTITIPSGVNGVRFQSATTSDTSLSIQKVYPKSFKTVETTIEDIQTVLDNKADYDLTYSIESGNGKYIRTNGVTATDTRFYYRITNLIPCSEGDQYIYKGYSYAAASVLYYLNGVFVSGFTLTKNTIITIPTGVNGVIFQSAKMSDDVVLSVQKLYPTYPKNVISGTSDNCKKIWSKSSAGAMWETPRLPAGNVLGEIDFVTLFNDESLYPLTIDSRWYCSGIAIPAFSYIDRVRFKSASSGTGYIIIASTEDVQNRYMLNKKVFEVSFSEGWNEIPINYNVGEHDNYLIGHKNLNLLYTDNTVLDGDVSTIHTFGHGTCYESNASNSNAENQRFAFSTINQSKKLCMAFDAHIYIGTILQSWYKLTRPDLPTIIDIPKYKVISGDVGYVGRWYDYTDNDGTYKVASSDGSYICFKVNGATNVSIEWGGNFTANSRISYKVDDDEFVRIDVDTNGNTIPIPDTNEHVIQIVMDAINVPDSWWPVGNGIGVKAVITDGTLKAVTPTNKRIMFFGDSLTQGVRALGMESDENPNCNSAINSYGWYMAKYLNATPMLVGYGSSGVTANGAFRKCIDAIDYVVNGIYTEDLDVDLIVINHGHNDSSASSADFSTAYNAVLKRFVTKYPAVPVLCVTPFNNVHSEDIKVCAESTPNCYFVDTKLWGLSAYYADGPGHLLATGADLCGYKLAKEVLALGIF